jgi:hypothetical protein
MSNYLFLLVLLVAAPLMGAGSFMPSEQEALELQINNKILAQVNGKAISAIDVMKKMDMIFYRQYPEYVGSKEARFQFYQASWKAVLDNLIDNELIKADAEEMKVEVTVSEVRKELESNFGPNIISNLDRIDMTLDEAEHILKDDLLIRKMMGYKVNGRAFTSIGPNQIREAYEEWAKENKVPELWNYSVVTIRDSDKDAGNVAAKRIAKLLKERDVPISEIKERAASEKALFGSTTLTVSEELSLPVGEISTSYKEALEGLEEGQFSDPVAQVSRSDASTVYRIFYLAGKSEEKLPPLNEVENQIKNGLLSKAVEKEGNQYTAYLRKHFAISDEEYKQLPKDYQPFALVPAQH